jgi:flagellar basal body-associated protein FliL
MEVNTNPYPGTGKGQNIAVIIIVVVVLGIVGYIIIKSFGGISSFFKSISGGADSVLQKLGVKDSAQETADKEVIQKAKEEASTISSPWNPAYYKNAPSGSLILSSATAKTIAKQVYDSVGYVSDNSDEALGAIKQCRTKTQVSFLADTFNKTYGKDLFSFMQTHFDLEQQIANLRAAVDYVNSLPAYK